MSSHTHLDPSAGDSGDEEEMDLDLLLQQEKRKRADVIRETNKQDLAITAFRPEDKQNRLGRYKAREKRRRGKQNRLGRYKAREKRRRGKQNRLGRYKAREKRRRGERREMLILNLRNIN
jgi:hypothetical protein